MTIVGRTAWELSPDEREAYRRAIAGLQEARRAAARRRAEQALGVARKAAAVLRQEFGAERVWLFGSLARGTFDAASDIDLAVDGIEEKAFLRALGRLISLHPDFSVDLVDIREARPGLRRAIEEEGVPL